MSQVDVTSAVQARVALRRPSLRDTLRVWGERLGIVLIVLGILGLIQPWVQDFFTNGFTAVIISLILSLFGLFGIGAGVSLTSGSPLWKSGGRQVILGLLAAGITFGLGKLIGSAIG